MELERHGLKVVLRKIDNFLPGDGDYLLAGRDGLTRKEIARHRQGRRRGLRPLHRRAGDGRPADQEMDAEGAARSRRAASARSAQAAAASAATWPACRPPKSASSTISRRRARATSSTAISRAISPRRCSGSTASSAISPRPTRRARPTSCSTICSARRRAFRAPGAMRSAAWARSPRRWPRRAARPGVDIVLNTPVEEIIVDKGRAAGVVAGGKAWRARTRRRRASIPSCCSTGWSRRARSTPTVEQRMHHWNCESATFRMNVALSELPKFTVLPEEGRSSDRRHHHGAEPRLHAPRLSSTPQLNGWSQAAGHRDADPLDARPDAWRPRASMSRRCSASISATTCRTGPQLGRRAREGRRHDHRHGRRPCAGLRQVGASAGRSIRRSTSSAASA